MMDMPLACNFDAIPPAEREPHRQRWMSLLSMMTGVEPLEEGRRLRFPLEADSRALHTLAAVIAWERLCCPFLHFQMVIVPQGTAIVLALSGPAGTRTLLAAELGLQAD